MSQESRDGSAWDGLGMSAFGEDDSREMPIHFFWGARRVDHAKAVRADTEKQNAATCPRYWYVDSVFPCARCGTDFTFSAEEQRTWYEEYGFWVDSLPRRCLDCRRALRNAKTLRQTYDAEIERALQSRDIELKLRVARVIDELC